MTSYTIERTQSRILHILSYILINLKEITPRHHIQLRKTFHKTSLNNREEGPLRVRAVRDLVLHIL